MSRALLFTTLSKPSIWFSGGKLVWQARVNDLKTRSPVRCTPHPNGARRPMRQPAGTAPVLFFQQEVVSARQIFFPKIIYCRSGRKLPTSCNRSRIIFRAGRNFCSTSHCQLAAIALLAGSTCNFCFTSHVTIQGLHDSRSDTNPRIPTIAKITKLGMLF